MQCRQTHKNIQGAVCIIFCCSIHVLFAFVVSSFWCSSSCVPAACCVSSFSSYFSCILHFRECSSCLCLFSACSTSDKGAWAGAVDEHSVKRGKSARPNSKAKARTQSEKQSSATGVQRTNQPPAMVVAVAVALVLPTCSTQPHVAHTLGSHVHGAYYAHYPCTMCTFLNFSEVRFRIRGYWTASWHVAYCPLPAGHVKLNR